MIKTNSLFMKKITALLLLGTVLFISVGSANAHTEKAPPGQVLVIKKAPDFTFDCIIVEPLNITVSWTEFTAPVVKPLIVAEPVAAHFELARPPNQGT